MPGYNASINSRRLMGWGYMRLCCHLVGSWSLIGLLRWVGLVVSMSASHAVGHGFMPRPCQGGLVVSVLPLMR